MKRDIYLEETQICFCVYFPHDPHKALREGDTCLAFSKLRRLHVDGGGTKMEGPLTTPCAHNEKTQA